MLKFFMGGEPSRLYACRHFTAVLYLNTVIIFNNVMIVGLGGKLFFRAVGGVLDSLQSRLGGVSVRDITLPKTIQDTH